MELNDEINELIRRIKLYRKHRWWENKKRFRREDPLTITKENLWERLQLCAGVSEALASKYTEQVYDELLEKINATFSRIKKKLLLRIELCDRGIKKEKRRLLANHDEFMAVIIENKLNEIVKTGEALRQELIDLREAKDNSLNAVEDVFSDSEMSWRTGSLPEFLSRAKKIRVRIEPQVTLSDLLKNVRSLRKV